MEPSPNPVEAAFDAAPTAPTIEAPAPERTVESAAPNGESPEGEPIDYKEKFSASSAEALRLLEEDKKNKAEIERLRNLVPPEPAEPAAPSEELYPGFEELDDASKENLTQFTESIRKRTLDDVYKDPAIAFARQTFNEKKFGEAFEKVLETLPELRESKDEFKAKYFNPTNVPDNIETILVDVGKSFLFDRARDIGTQEGREQAKRIDMERARGGAEGAIVPTTRTLEEWQRMQQENPAEFAKHSKEYQADMESGKLPE